MSKKIFDMLRDDDTLLPKMHQGGVGLFDNVFPQKKNALDEVLEIMGEKVEPDIKHTFSLSDWIRKIL